MSNLHRTANNAIGLVKNNPLTNLGTNLVVDAALDAKLNAIGSFPFWLTMWSQSFLNPNDASDVEIVSVAARPSANNYTIVRHQQGTSAVQHNLNDNVALLWTAGNAQEITTLDDVEDGNMLFYQGGVPKIFPASPDVIAKGTIIVFDSGGLPHTLAVGANGTSPVADSTQTLGFRYAQISRFGGTGADGALSISSGTTTINLGGASVFIKNYTSISITGTAVLNFSNPNANGTLIILKSQGNVVMTSSATPMIDASGMGGSGGSAGNVSIGTGDGGAGNSGTISFFSCGGGAGAVKLATSASGGTIVTSAINPIAGTATLKYPMVFCGAGGGGGNSNGGTVLGGAGGAGGGGLIIECGGALNFTTGSISVAGKNGTNGTTDGSHSFGGGAGGGGGCCVILYNSLTANTGSIINAGGTGGTGNSGLGGGGGAGSVAGSNTTTGGGASGGAGGVGTSFIGLNTEFS